MDESHDKLTRTHTASTPPTSTVPTTPARWTYIARLLITWFAFYKALLGPAIVGVGVKASPRTGNEKDPRWLDLRIRRTLRGDAKPVFGRISDRTTSRWGRRRIWIVSGMAGLVVGFVGFMFAPNIPTAVVAWAFCQFCANAALSP